MKRKTRMGLVLAAVAAVLFLFGRFFAMPYVVIGESMSPTLRPWDLCLMRVVRHCQSRRGDIVVFRTADDPPLYFIKRVIALPGETVSIERGIMRVNGAPLAEPYTTINTSWQLKPMPVPASKVFVIGDNRDLLREDYVLGLVATRLIKARLIWHWRWKR